MRGSTVRTGIALLLFGLIVGVPEAAAEAPLVGAVPRFAMPASDIRLSRPAQPFTPFDKVGRRFAILGYEGGQFEAWAYPLKILREFRLSFLTGTSTVPIEGRDVVRFVSVDPAVTTLTFTDQSFTVRAHFITSVEDPAAVILLEVDAIEPLTVVASFLPVLQPMWPAGLGGQYAYWDQDLRAYLISEPTRKNHGFVGSPAATGISYTPAHMLSDTPNQFKIEIADPKSASGVFIPVILAGGKGRREDVRAVYQKLAGDPEACYRDAVRHYAELCGSTLRIRTPERQLDRALEWAKIALDNLIVDNPDLGRGVVAGLGPSGTGVRPGFGWFFGTDAYLNSLSFNSLGDYAASRDALAFTRKWQRRDGKMAHELSQAAGYLNWWEDYPYGYIHGDTTPYYIVAAGDYFRATGDMDFLRASWPSLGRAYDWCLTTDADGDGLMDNAKAGLGALEFGALTGIRTDIYLASVWARANAAMREMAAAMGDKPRADVASKNGARAARAFDEKFWDAERGQYSFAFDKDGHLVPELTPWSAVGIAWGLGTGERGLGTLVRMSSPDLATDWGTRMLSVRSPYFEPLNYNYGAVWPFLTGWVSTAMLRSGLVPQGYGALLANVRHTFDNGLGSVTELFSGFANVWPREGVPHQGFSTTGIVLPLVRGLLGLEGNAGRKEVSFAPCFPADWREVSVSGWKIGRAVFALDFERTEAKVTLRVRSEGAAGYRLRFSPAFGPGTAVRSASLGGVPLRIEAASPVSSGAVRPVAEIPLTGDDTIEILIDPVPEIVPPRTRTMTGDLNHGLKIIRTEAAGREIRIHVEGLAGETYELELRNGSFVDSVSGADLEGDGLRLTFPAGRPGEFLGRTIVLRLKS
jgi:glycogen debranching enzyme